MKYLVVVDMQNDFIDGALGTPEAQKVLPLVVEKVRNFDGEVIFTRDTHAPNYMETQEGKNLPVIHCVQDEPGWQLAEALDTWRKENPSTVFDKVTFGCKELPEFFLQRAAEAPIESIEFCGVCTDICVVSNALLLKAFLPEVPMSAAADCCAGTTVANHESALNTMKMCQIQITGGENK